jgi:hypothetical protein
MKKILLSIPGRLIGVACPAQDAKLSSMSYYDELLADDGP